MSQPLPDRIRVKMTRVEFEDAPNGLPEKEEISTATLAEPFWRVVICSETWWEVWLQDANC
jgi:hypothetical protein